MTGLHDLTLSHFTSRPGLTPHDVAQTKAGYKPAGLWVSVDGPDDWPAWCEREEFRDLTRQHEHRVTLASDARVLHLATVDDLRAFTRRFPDEYFGLLGFIDWAAVAAEYQGIVIAPYQWLARFELGFYYGWDCASGCIWDPAAIASVELIREAVPA